MEQQLEVAVPRRCLIVDTETTGIDPKDHRIVEIGAVLYSVENGGTIAQYSMLYPLVPGRKNEAVAINGITDELLEEVYNDDRLVQMIRLNSNPLREFIGASDVILAHKAEFDYGFLQPFDDFWTNKPWLCTKSEFVFKHGKPGDSLINLTLAHGLGVASAHRALTDCQNLARIFDTYSREEREALFRHAMLPRETYVAETRYAQKDLAKARGFGWDPENKVWTKKLTADEAADITEFKIRVHGE